MCRVRTRTEVPEGRAASEAEGQGGMRRRLQLLFVELEQQRTAAEVLAHPWPEDSRLEPPADPLRPLLWLQQLEEPQLGSEVREVWERGTACEGGRARGWDFLGGRVLERVFGASHS